MSNFLKTIVLVATFFLGFGQVANAWTPDKEVEIVAHAKETSSTVAFARGIIKVIEEENLLPNGVKLTIIRGARGGKARNYVLNKNKSPHVLQVLTPSQINNVILTGQEIGYQNAKAISALVVSPLLLTVNADSEYKSLQDIIDKAKANPGKVVQGGGDFGQVASLMGKMIAEEKGVEMTYVPFDDEGVLQLLGGHIDFILENPGQVFKFVKAGKMRILASSVKLASMPDVPTFKKAGYKGTILAQYRGLWFSSENTKAQAKFYTKLMKKVAKTQTFKVYVNKNNLASISVHTSKLDKMLKEEHEAYFKLDTELNLIKK